MGDGIPYQKLELIAARQERELALVKESETLGFLPLRFVHRQLGGVFEVVDHFAREALHRPGEVDAAPVLLFILVHV